MARYDFFSLKKVEWRICEMVALPWIFQLNIRLATGPTERIGHPQQLATLHQLPCSEQPAPSMKHNPSTCSVLDSQLIVVSLTGYIGVADGVQVVGLWEPDGGCCRGIIRQGSRCQVARC